MFFLSNKCVTFVCLCFRELFFQEVDKHTLTGVVNYEKGMERVVCVI